MTSIRCLLLAIIVSVVISFTGCGKSLREAPSSRRIESTPTPARSFLFKDEAPQIGLGAYGYLVLTKRPAKEEKERYLRICESYTRSLEATTAYSEYSPASLMVTHWFVDAKRTDIKNLHDCQSLIDVYDYARATAIAKAVNKLGSQGPILVAWATSYSSDLPLSSALVLDLTQCANDDLDRAFAIWKERIVQDSSVWNNGFDLVKIRECFRNILQQYGEQILSVVKPKLRAASDK